MKQMFWQLTDEQYRALPRIANSDLGELLNLQTKGITGKTIDPKAAAFGTAFHRMILEPDLADTKSCTIKERYALMQMQESYRTFADRFRHNTPLSFDYTEHVLLFDVEVLVDSSRVKVPCKAKLDAVSLFDGKKWAIDLKTTSAKSSQEFFDCFEQYGYDRQAAFYMDALNMVEGLPDSNCFLFIGIQKQRPYDIFTINMNLRQKMMDTGRMKYTGLLRKAARELANPTGWRPSSWQNGPLFTGKIHPYNPNDPSAGTPF